MIRAFGWAVSFLCIALPAFAVQDKTGDSRPATALESMLAGHVCGQPKSQDPADVDARERCAQEQRLALRADFGYDLGRLSTGERLKLNATCARVRTSYDVEPYLNCLTQGLVSLRAQWTPGTSGQPSFGLQTVVAPAAAPPAPARRWSWLIVTLSAGSALAVAALTVVELKKRRRRVERLCRDCGAAMQSAGDLCSACRHRAAAAIKQAIADRAEQEHAEQDARRRQQEEAAERERLREEQEAQFQREIAAQQAEQARRAAETPPPPEVMSSQPPDDTPEVFDPYAILSVTAEASPEQIETAYREAKSQFDEDQVAHLGDEVRMFYKMKAEAVEEAYRTLSGSIPA
jgi:DnaJ-domain-containing protein 1